MVSGILILKHISVFYITFWHILENPTFFLTVVAYLNIFFGSRTGVSEERIRGRKRAVLVAVTSSEINNKTRLHAVNKGNNSYCAYSIYLGVNSFCNSLLIIFTRSFCLMCLSQCLC